MHKPDPVETILARLMPPGLSEQGLGDIEDMLDELAADAPPVVSVKPASNPWLRWILASSGIAAAGMVAALVFPMASVPSPVAKTAQALESETPAGIVLVSESDRVESMTDEGWQEDSDGSAMRAMRLNVVEENNFFDEETGIVMQVSEPREEVLLMPVSTF